MVEMFEKISELVEMLLWKSKIINNKSWLISMYADGGRRTDVPLDGCSRLILIVNLGLPCYSKFFLLQKQQIFSFFKNKKLKPKFSQIYDS